MSSKRNWPAYGQRGRRSKEQKVLFKIESKNIYVDFPNRFISFFIDQLLGEIEEKFSGAPEKGYNEAKRLAEEYNRKFQEEYNGDWLKFIVARREFAVKHPYYGIQFRVKWEEFFGFLDEFAESERRLIEKYDYLNDSRGVALQLEIRGSANHGRIQKEVEGKTSADVDNMTHSVGQLASTLEEFRNELFKISKRKTVQIPPYYPNPPFTLYYISEMIGIFQGISSLVENGSVPACYREMRKVMENLCWTIFDDVLFYNSKYYEMSKKVEIKQLSRPYLYANKYWYEWAKNKGFFINHLGELDKKAKELVDLLHLHSGMRGYKWSKKAIKHTIYGLMTYPIFLVVTGKEIKKKEYEKSKFNKRKYEEFLPVYFTSDITALAEENLRNIVKELKGKRLSKSDKNFAKEAIDSISEDYKSIYIVPPFPTYNFVMNYVNKLFYDLGINIPKIYSEYSHFVHSYSASWQIYPFSSVLEFKILKNQIDKFKMAIEKLLRSYIDHCFY